MPYEDCPDSGIGRDILSPSRFPVMVRKRATLGGDSASTHPAREPSG